MSLGRQKRDEAMEAVEASTASDWFDEGLECLRGIARRQAELSTNDLWRVLERPREPRAAGPLMSRAAALGIIERTGRAVESTIPGQHARPVALWRSLLWRE